MLCLVYQLENPSLKENYLTSPLKIKILLPNVSWISFSPFRFLSLVVSLVLSFIPSFFFFKKPFYPPQNPSSRRLLSVFLKITARSFPMQFIFHQNSFNLSQVPILPFFMVLHILFYLYGSSLHLWLCEDPPKIPFNATYMWNEVAATFLSQNSNFGSPILHVFDHFPNDFPL